MANRISNYRTSITRNNKFYGMDSSFIDNGFNIYESGDGKLFFNLLAVRSFPENLPKNKYTIHTIRNHETLQEVAYIHYKNINLWWIIAEANHMNNPFDYMENGIQLKIPNEEFVSDIIMENYSE